MIESLLNGPKWVRGAIFVIVLVILGGIALVAMRGADEPPADQSAPPSAQPTVAPLIPNATATPEPTKESQAPNIETPPVDAAAGFPMSQKDLNEAAKAAIDFQIAANTFTFETSPEEYLARLDLLAYNGNGLSVLGGGEPGPLGLNPSEAQAKKLTVEGRAQVMETVLVTPNSATFLIGSTADITENGKAMPSSTFIQQLAVERDGSQWKVVSLSAPLETFDTEE